jgi:hypothetical protein
MEAALAEILAEDIAKDVEDDIDFVNDKGIVNPLCSELVRIEYLCLTRGGRHFRIRL